MSLSAMRLRNELLLIVILFYRWFDVSMNMRVDLTDGLAVSVRNKKSTLFVFAI